MPTATKFLKPETDPNVIAEAKSLANLAIEAARAGKTLSETDFASVSRIPKTVTWAPMSKQDRMGFDGAEDFSSGQPPLTAEITLIDHEGVEKPALAIVSPAGVEIYPDEFDNTYYAKYADGDEEAALAASKELKSVVSHKDLTSAGYEHIGMMGD